MDLMEISTQELQTLQGPSVVQPLKIGDIQTEGFILTPNTPEQLAKLLYLASDQKTPLALRLNDALLMTRPLWMNLEKLNTIRNYRKADLVITVETGITMGALEKELKANGHRFPLSYPPQTLLADVIAQDRPAPESGFHGFPRDYVLGVEIVTPDGLITHYGGEVVKNVTGYDLNKLYTGSQQTLGVITSVTLKLMAQYDAVKHWVFQTETSSSQWSSDLFSILHRKQLPLTACELFKSNNQEGWQIWIQAEGPKLLLDRLSPEINETLAHACQGPTIQLSEDQPDFKLKSHLEQSHIVKIAIAKGSQAFEKTIQDITERLPNPKSYQIQARPAAGLIHIVWQAGDLPKLKDLERPLTQLAQTVSEQQGHLQLLDFSAEFMALTQRLNFPHNPIAKSLMHQVKAQYDPQQILFSRRLPFSYLNLSIKQASL